MSDPRTLARHLASCCRSGAALSLDAADLKVWVLALEQLIAWNAFEAAAYAAPRLREAFPTLSYFRSMAIVLEHLPPREPGHDADLTVDAGRGVQIVRRPGDADAVLFAFTGRYGSLGVPLQLLHRWFGRLPAHIIYLRDPLDNAFELGLPGLASDRAGTVRSLLRIADELGASRICCYGNSTGGYGALRYGLDMNARAVLAFGAVTTLTDTVWRERVGARRPFVAGPDLRPLYEAATSRPRVRLVFGGDNAFDVDQARRLEDVPGVTLEVVPSWAGHNVFLDLIERGRYAKLLADLLSPCLAQAGNGVGFDAG